MKTDVVLSNECVVLRRYRASDVQAVYEAARESIAELTPWFAWAHEQSSIQEAELFITNQAIWWDDGSVYNFAITDRTTGAYCGGCLLNHINRGDRFANMAYWVRTSWTGKGIATAAARLVAHYGFEHLGLHRVEIIAAKENLASIRVAEKVGAVREGVLRRRITVRDKVYDAVLFSLIPGDM
ncbi:MAG: GNAT family N-acetyltransferase [Chloroflexales bacterium]|nr:GNAT family N-acetyltransferase [Chloroflexales bacterium]